MGNRTWRSGLAVLALFSGTAAALVNRWLFPLYSINRDDSVYVAMARMLEQGRVTLPAGQDLLRPWASAVVDGRIVLKYSLPWPSVLALADVVTGSTVVGLAVTAAATAVLTAVLAAEVLRDRVTGLVAGALLAFSPLFVLQSALYLPYVFQLCLGLGSVTLLLAGVRRRSTVRLLAAGAVLAVDVFARPFDAVLFALPFAVLVLLDPRLGRPAGEPGWTRPRLVARVMAGALPVLAGSLVYNAVVVGGPFRLPFTVTGPQDTFGFGRRGVFPQSTIPFTPADGVTGMLVDLRWTPSWVAGGIVLVALAVLGLVRSRGRARWAVAALALVVPLGYLPFWGPHAIGRLWAGVQTMGPFYHLPVIVPLVVLGAAGLVDLARRPARWARPVLAVAAVAMVALTALAVPDKVAANLAVRDDYRAVQRFVAAQHLDDAVLLLPRRGDLGFLSDTPFLENDPSPHQSVLYAEDRGAAVLELLDSFPDRTVYRLSEDLPAGADHGGELGIEELRVDRGAAVTLRLRLTDPTDEGAALTYLRIGDATWTQPLDPAARHGDAYDVTWTIAAPDAPVDDDPSMVRLPADADDGVLSVGLATGGDDGARWERRMAYRTTRGGAALEVLRPGQAWARAADGPWLLSSRGNPVQDVG